MWSEDHVTLWVSSPQYKSPPTKFGGRRRCVRKDNSFLVCHVTTWSESFDIMGEFFVISDYTAKFGDHSSFGREDINLLVFHVTPLDHVVRGLCDIMGEFP